MLCVKKHNLPVFNIENILIIIIIIIIILIKIYLANLNYEMNFVHYGIILVEICIIFLFQCKQNKQTFQEIRGLFLRSKTSTTKKSI